MDKKKGRIKLNKSVYANRKEVKEKLDQFLDQKDYPEYSEEPFPSSLPHFKSKLPFRQRYLSQSVDLQQ